jgi:hypothetical protein
VATGAIAIGATATSTSITKTISTKITSTQAEIEITLTGPVSSPVEVRQDRAIGGNTILLIVATRLMATEGQPTNSGAPTGQVREIVRVKVSAIVPAAVASQIIAPAVVPGLVTDRVAAPGLLTDRVAVPGLLTGQAEVLE